MHNQRCAVDNYDLIRLAAFAIVFTAIGLLEILAPRRQLTTPRRPRWFTNLVLGLLNQAVLRLLFPVLLVSFAGLARQRDWGLLNNLDLPVGALVAVGFLLLDLTIYAQHRLFHRVPMLWRLHRVHHSDLDFDFTTAVRFHPLEIILSMLIKMAVVALLGPPILAVLLFELALSLNALFSHGNIRLPELVDRVLRWVIVTPDFHRVHHSIRVEETNSNYSFNLSCWDRLFRSYRAQPSGGHLNMRIGQEQFPDADELGLGKLLRQPFQGDRFLGRGPTG